MSTESGDVPDEALEGVETGLRTYFTVDAARQLLEAIDQEALIEEAMVEEAVDYEELGKILGRLIGQAVAKEITSYAPLGQIIEEVIGREIGGKLGEAAVVAFIKYGNPTVAINRIRTLTESGELNRISNEITTTATENSIRDYLPSFGTTEEFVEHPDDAMVIDVTDESLNEG